MPTARTVFRALSLGVASASLVATAFAGGQDPNDPFVKKVEKKKIVVAAPAETVVAPPSYEERVQICRQRTGAGRSVTDKPCVYLVHEVSFSGVSSSDNGLEAFLKAAPSGNTIVVHEGDELFDGRVVAIREADGSGEASVLLEKTTQKYVGRKLVTTTSRVTLRLGDGSDL